MWFLKLQNGNSDFIIEAIDNGLVDLGFVIEPIDLEKLNFLKMNQLETWGILMKADSPLASKDYLRSIRFNKYSIN